MRRWRGALLGAAAALTVVAAIPPNRSLPDGPFRIAGNLYYVGDTGVTAFLLTGPEGHLLIAGGDSEAAPLIIAGIAGLGFDVADVRVSLTSHAHSDSANELRTPHLEHRYEDSATIRTALQDASTMDYETRVATAQTLPMARRYGFVPSEKGFREMAPQVWPGGKFSPSICTSIGASPEEANRTQVTPLSL
jgi:hypothetical protein